MSTENAVEIVTPQDKFVVQYMVTDTAGDVAAVVNNIETAQGRRLGFVLFVSITKRMIDFYVHEGDDFRGSMPATEAEHRALVPFGDQLLPDLKVKAMLDFFSGGNHACSKCGECGKKFDADGNEQPTADSAEPALA